MTSSGTTAHYQGADPDLLNELSRGLAQTGAALVDHRVGIQQLLDQLGLPPAPLDGLRRVEQWVADKAADTRRRAGSAAPTAHVNPSVHTMTGRPVFEQDLLSGMALRGYCIAGLSYRHLGVERREVKRTLDYGGGWIETVDEHQSRGVFEVEPGIGYGWVSLATFGPRRMYDPWRKGSTTTSYHHDAEQVDAATFREATGAS